MSLSALLFWAMYVGGIAAALFNPVVGVMLYVLVYHLNPETQWWGGSVQALGLRTSFTVALATGLGMLLRMPRLHHGARQFPLPYVLALLLTVVALGSLVWGLGMSERSEYQAEKLVKVMIIIFIIIRCVRTPLHYQLVLFAWLAGVFYVGYEATGGVGVTRGGRLTGGLGGPDFAESSGLAVHLVATLPLIGAIFFMLRTWWSRGLVLITGALAVNTLIMTRTRNALAGLFALAVATVLSLPRGYRVKGLAAIVAGTLLAVQLTDPAWWRRIHAGSGGGTAHSPLASGPGDGPRPPLWHRAGQLPPRSNGLCSQSDDHPRGSQHSVGLPRRAGLDRTIPLLRRGRPDTVAAGTSPTPSPLSASAHGDPSGALEHTLSPGLARHSTACCHHRLPGLRHVHHTTDQRRLLAAHRPGRRAEQCQQACRRRTRVGEYYGAAGRGSAFRGAAACRSFASRPIAGSFAVPMNLALLIENLEVGGSEAVVQRLALGLARRGHRVFIYCLHKADVPVGHLQAGGITVRELEGRRHAVRLLPRLFRCFRRDRIELAHAHCVSAALCAFPVASLLRVPLVHVWHGWNPERPTRRRHLAALLARYLAGVGINSESLRFRLPTCVPRSKLVSLPNGIDLPAPDPTAARQLLADLCGAAPAGPIVLSIGNIRVDKDQATLLRAAALLRRRWPDLRVAIVGLWQEEACGAELRQLHQSLGLQRTVIFAGPVPDAWRLLAGADVFCLSSVRESMPNVVLEAMSQGVPIVATAVGDVGSFPPHAEAHTVLRHGETALLVPPGQPRGLWRAPCVIRRRRAVGPLAPKPTIVAVTAPKSWCDATRSSIGAVTQQRASTGQAVPGPF